MLILNEIKKKDDSKRLVIIKLGFKVTNALMSVLVLSDKPDYLPFSPPLLPRSTDHHLKLRKLNEILLFSVLFYSDFQNHVSDWRERWDCLGALVTFS